MLLTATANVFKLQEWRFISTHKYSCVTAWQWTLAYAGITVGILAESHRDPMGSHRIPSGLTEIPQNPEFLSRWDHGKSRRDWGGIPLGSRRDPVGIPQNPEFLSRWDPSESRRDPGESRRDPSESRRDPDYIPVESH